jgi:hypothetical protein
MLFLFFEELQVFTFPNMINYKVFFLIFAMLLKWNSTIKQFNHIWL